MAPEQINPSRVLGWHWTDGWRLRDGAAFELDHWYEHDGPLVMCDAGYHAVRACLDALDYAPGTLVSRVELSGDMIEEDGKIVARRRRALWAVEAERILHEFACWCAEAASAIIGSPDPRSIDAITAKRAWLRGELSDYALRAARWSAWVAARDEGRADRWSAWIAAGNDAGRSARNAAWAVRDIVWVVARDAGGAVRRAAWATRNADRIATRREQNARLTAMLCSAHQSASHVGAFDTQ